MPLSNIQVIIMISVAAVCTFVTRVIPFALFGGKKEVPKFVKYLGNILPPKLIAVVLTAGVHFWKRSTLLSISVGTIGYMLLIHFVFV